MKPLTVSIALKPGDRVEVTEEGTPAVTLVVNRARLATLTLLLEQARKAHA